jgi:hypothetical protein
MLAVNFRQPYPSTNIPRSGPRFDNLPFSVLSDRRRGRQKNEPCRGIGARWRGSGMATTLYCGSFVEGKPKKLPTKVGYLFQAARRLKTATRALVK